MEALLFLVLSGLTLTIIYLMMKLSEHGFFILIQLVKYFGIGDLRKTKKAALQVHLLNITISIIILLSLASKKILLLCGSLLNLFVEIKILTFNGEDPIVIHFI